MNHENATESTEAIGSFLPVKPTCTDYPSILREETGLVHVPELNRDLNFRRVSVEDRPIEFGEKLPTLETILWNENYTSFVYHERAELDHLLTATYEIIPDTE